jgi:hypothetical protein
MGLIAVHTAQTQCAAETAGLEVVTVVGPESKEADRANAESPEQHARYEEYRALLDADPEWHDGEIIFAYPE